MEHDLIGLGETMLALSPPAGESLRTAATLAIDHAGPESNTCVGSGSARSPGRLDQPPRHRRGGRPRHRRDSPRSVDVQWVERDAERSTGLMLKNPGAGVHYYRRHSAASAMGPALLDAVPVASARAVLVTASPR
jgi:2-dehydro-3-deoxygluconokinase